MQILPRREKPSFIAQQDRKYTYKRSTEVRSHNYCVVGK